MQSSEDTDSAQQPGNSREAEKQPAGNPNSAAIKPSSAGKPQVLLAVFERPPGAPGETVDSAVVIATEPRESYPQIKTAADYFGPISDLASQRGLKALSDPYSFTVGSKRLVREDFSAEQGKATVFQSSLVMMADGQIVSFTLIGASEDDVDNLLSGLSFIPLAPKYRRP